MIKTIQDTNPLEFDKKVNDFEKDVESKGMKVFATQHSTTALGSSIILTAIVFYRK